MESLFFVCGVLGSLVVSSVGEQVNSVNPDLIVRSLTLEGMADNETDNVQIFHYTNWPQYGKYTFITGASFHIEALALLYLMLIGVDLIAFVCTKGLFPSILKCPYRALF